MRNRSYLISLIPLCGLLLQAQTAQAAITCTISSPGWISSYFTTTATNTTTSSSVTVNCTRLLADPATATYTLRANYGVNGGSIANRIAKAIATMTYNEFMDPAFATVWGNPVANRISVPINFGAGTTYTGTFPFYVRITALQNVAAGIYTDTITMTLKNRAITVATATHSVSIIVNPVCTISTPPGNIAFAYTSFQATAAAASTTFAVNCTNLVPYTASLDLYTATDTATNIVYTLNVGQTTRPAGSVYTAGAALAAQGSGLAQTISIDGSIAAGQGGKCTAATCAGSTIRTLTITY